MDVEEIVALSVSITSPIYTCAVIRHRAGAGQAVLNLRRFRPRMWRRY